MLPDPEPTCTDGLRNRDEEGVDCGGSFCTPCPTTRYSGDYYRYFCLNAKSVYIAIECVSEHSPATNETFENSFTGK